MQSKRKFIAGQDLLEQAKKMLKEKTRIRKENREAIKAAEVVAESLDFSVILSDTETK